MRPQLVSRATAAVIPLAVLVSSLVVSGPAAAAGADDSPTGAPTSAAAPAALAAPAAPPALPAAGTTLTGTVERVVVDRFDGTDTEIAAVVPEVGEAVVVRLADLEDVPSGSVAEVTVGSVTAANQDVVGPSAGAEVTDVKVLVEPAAAGHGSAERAAGPAEAPAIARLDGGARTVHVLTALLPGQRSMDLLVDGVTPTDLAADVATTVSPYWSESTGGAVTFTAGTRTSAGTFADWGSPATCSNTQILDFLAWTATQAGVYPAANNGRHTVTYTPHLSACGFAGVAHVADGGSAWINGTEGATPRADVLSHELGHTLSLGHSDARTACRTGSDGTAAQCTAGPYGDAYDVMGTKLGNAGPINGAHLDALGLLGGESTVRVAGTTAVTLEAVGTASGIRFATFTTGGATYYVEHRGAVGRDADLASTRYGWPRSMMAGPVRYGPGVVVHRVDDPVAGAPSHLLSMTGGEAGFVLPVGGTFTSADGTHQVRVVSTTARSAQVEVFVREATDVPSTDAPVTTASSGLVRTSTDASVYLVAGSVKHHVTSLDLLTALGPLGPVRYLPQATVDRLRTGPAFRRVVAAPDGTVSFVESGIRLPFGSCARVADFGSTCGQAIPLEAAQIARLHPGPPMPNLYRTTSGKAFYVTAGTRREVTDLTALAQAGLPSTSVTLVESGVASLPYGPPITRDGQVLRSRTSATTVLSTGGQYVPLPQRMDRTAGLGALPTAVLDEPSLAALPRTAALHPIVRDEGTSHVYLLTTLGKVHLTDPAALPTAVTPATASTLARVPAAGAAGGAVFVKGEDDATVYYLRAGQRRPIRAWADLVALGNGVAPPIHTLPGGSASLLAPGPVQVAPGSLLMSPDNGTVYLADGTGGRVTVGSFAVTSELGATRLAVLPAADVAHYALGAGMLTTAVACGTERYLGLSGRLHPVSPTIAATYRLTFTTLDPSTCRALPRSTRPLDRFLRTPDGTIYHVVDGVKRPISWYGRYLQLGGTAANTIDVTAFTGSLFRTGPLA